MSDIPSICQCGHHETFHFLSMSGMRICRLCLQIGGRCVPAISRSPTKPDHSINPEKLSEVIRIVQVEEEKDWHQNTSGPFVELASVITERLLRPWPAEGQIDGYWEERQQWFDTSSAEEIAKVFLSPVIG